MKVFIIAALTADGYIAKNTGHLSDWTTPEDKKLFVKLTKEAGVIIMGSKTFNTIGHILPGRRMVVYTTKPQNITAAGVEVTTEKPQILLKRLKREGARGVAICGGAEIYTLFMKKNLVDELYLSIEPKMFGGGITLFNAPIESDLSLVEVAKLNDHTVLLHYSVSK